MAPPLWLARFPLGLLVITVVQVFSNTISSQDCPPDSKADCHSQVEVGHCLSERFTEMLSGCATSCGFCVMKDVATNGTKVAKFLKAAKADPYPSEKWTASPCTDSFDKHLCAERASEGLCGIIPDFMVHNCAASCKTCGRGPGLDCDSSRPMCRKFLAGLQRRHIACGAGATCLATMGRASLLQGWSAILSILNRSLAELSSDVTNTSFAHVDLVLEQDCRKELDGMRSVLRDFASAFEGSIEDHRLLPFYFPRAAISQDFKVLSERAFLFLPRGAHARAFFDLVSEVLTSLWQMALTDTEKTEFLSMKRMKLAEPSQRAAEEDVNFSTDRSFGNALHMVNEFDDDDLLHVMEDWELPWMHQLVDRAVARAQSQRVAEGGECSRGGGGGGSSGGKDEWHVGGGSCSGGGGTLRILEIGWGQGISGRRLLGAGRPYGTAVEYTVIEPHPTVAENARAVAAAQFPGVPFRVLEGVWQEVMPDLLAHSFDCVVADFYETENGVLSSEGWSHHRFFLMTVYRLLSHGGVFAWFDGSFGGTFNTAAEAEMFGEATRFYTRLFSNYELSYVNRLKPTNNTYYASSDAVVPVGVK